MRERWSALVGVRHAYFLIIEASPPEEGGDFIVRQATTEVEYESYVGAS
jgi:hypothetical protein